MPTSDPNTTRRCLMLTLRVLAIAAFVVFTNSGFLQRIVLLHEQGRWFTLFGFLGVWGLSMAALLIAALHRNVWVRGFWALIVAATTAIGFAYRHASGTEFSIFDAVSLWSARHEASRAMDFYGSDFVLLGLVFAAGLALLTIPPALPIRPVQRWLTRLIWTPALPVAVIAAIILVKEGGGAEVLPTQFAPLSVGLVSAAKIATEAVPERQDVHWTPGPRKVRHVVMLVDESLRADYLDWTPGNPYTPNLARLRDRFIHFGPAVSGGNCSHYSNALLRFAANPDHLGAAVLTNPTLWQYAKHAGYRTVYIDAQSAFNRNPGKLQNFMNGDETRSIDRLVTMPDGMPAPQLDDRLLDTVIAELRSPKPVFIYANKNGAHFPYDNGYPASERLFRPTMTDVADGDAHADRKQSDGGAGAASPSRINSYRNAVRWTVDRFFKRLFEEADLTDTVVLYTSDHGQQFDPDRLSHCTVENPDPREGLVPLMAITQDASLRAQFAAGAAASRYHANHFELAPTLFDLFGYARKDIASLYGPTLFDADRRPAAFTSGDIFGLFSDKVRWHPLDLAKSYLEPEALRARPQDLSARVVAPPVLAQQH